MTISIDCECGNKVKVNTQDKKALLIKDVLEKNRFYFEKEKDGFCITCEKCRRFVILDVN
ncbi:MAG: hypothetical protein K6E85_16430 [Lachnospiraceae bacterium]|nr:hypothetical protein [Lachnospiraceae bacterium]